MAKQTKHPGLYKLGHHENHVETIVSTFPKQYQRTILTAHNPLKLLLFLFLSFLVFGPTSFDFYLLRDHFKGLFIKVKARSKQKHAEEFAGHYVTH